MACDIYVHISLIKLKLKWIGKCSPTVCPEGEKEQAEYMRTALLTTTCVPTWGMPLFYGMFHSHYFMTIPRAVLLKLISVLLEQGFSKWIPWILLRLSCSLQEVTLAFHFLKKFLMKVSHMLWTQAKGILPSPGSGTFPFPVRARTRKRRRTVSSVFPDAHL